jgi:multiple sugar transport system permease protein
MAYPLLVLLWQSFFVASEGSSAASLYTGLKNYRQVVNSQRFLNSIVNTIIYVASSVSVEFLIGILFALIISRMIKAGKLIRALLLIPLMIPPIVTGLIWRFIFTDQYGILNWSLAQVRLIRDAHSILWLSNEHLALLSCIIVDVWMTSPFMILSFIAGLNGLPDSPFESARIDGANSLQIFWYMTLPLMKKVILVILIIRVIDAAKTFDIIWVLTGGGPEFVSELITILIYKSLTRFVEIGPSSAMSVIMLIIMLSIFLLSYKQIWKAKE